MSSSILKLIRENTSPSKLPMMEHKNIKKLSDQNLFSLYFKSKIPIGIEKTYEIKEKIKKVIGKILISAEIVANSSDDLNAA